MNNTYADFLTDNEVPVYRAGAKCLVRREAGARGQPGLKRIKVWITNLSNIRDTP